MSQPTALEALEADIYVQYDKVKRLREAAEQVRMTMMMAREDQFPALREQFTVIMRELMKEDRDLTAMADMHDTLLHEQEVAEWEAGRNQDHA